MGDAVGGRADPPVIRLAEDRRWDREAEVVVVGTGVAGSSAAINCADLGASVVVLEKGDTAGGTSAKAGAGAMVPNNRYLQAAGQEDPREDFIALLARVGRPLLYDPADPHYGLPAWEYALIETYYDHAATAWTHMEELGAMRMVHTPEWPTYNELPQDKSRFGRVLFNEDDAGQMDDGRGAMDRMHAKATEMGVEIVLGFRVDGVYVNEAGEVVGVRGTEGGEARSVRATKAVVFATGGFTHSERYMREYLNGQYVGGCAARTSTGDLIPIAKSLGLPLHGMQSAWGAPVVWEQALDEDPALIANFSLVGDGVIQVNRFGLRCGNEKATYNDRTQSHFVWDPAGTEYPNFLQFVVMDRRTRERFGRTGHLDVDAGNFVPPPGETSRYLLEGATLEELAERFAERLAAHGHHNGEMRLADDFVANLRGSIARFNAFARRGVDEDFHRGEAAIQRLMHGGRADDNDLPNETMFPIADEGPYYGTILAPGSIETKGGPKVNARMQMLDGDEEPVPGLYGVGNCVASASGQAYWSGGSTWGPYLTFGYVAARSIVQEPVKAIGGLDVVAAAAGRSEGHRIHGTKASSSRPAGELLRAARHLR
jgi:succinate dehydrogenase/fumarate reductase flavoprotein subunit